MSGFARVVKATDDRRVARTKQALQQAFTRLFFQNGYEAVTVGDVAQEANVGRSTFYEHFKGKEDILWACMSRFFVVFAEAVTNDAPPADLEKVLAHLWDSRKRADAVFTGAPRQILSRRLAALIEARLTDMAKRRRSATPLRLAAIQIAEAQLVLVHAWLMGRAACTQAAMRDALHASSYAGARAMMFGLGDPA